MAEYEIYTDSCCDLPKEMVEKYGLHVMQLEVNIDGNPPILNKDININEFYKQLHAGANAKTSAVTLGYFEEHMKRTLEEGKDILYLGFSSSLSATYSNAVMVINELKETFPERKIVHIDTLCASGGQGLLVFCAAELKAAGAPIEEVVDEIMMIKDDIHHLITVDNLFFLKRGGRLSTVEAVAGSMLSVKPVIVVDEDGTLKKVGTVRGRKKALKELYERMRNGADFDTLGYIFIMQADCMENAETLKTMIQEEYPDVQPIIMDFGPVIGAHLGPGGLALCFLGKGRKGY